MRVYTVAGNIWTSALGDEGPATAAGMSGTEGVWVDGKCNLYFSDDGHGRVRKVNLETGIINTIAGTMSGGSSGDGGLATNAQLDGPYGIYADSTENIFIVDAGIRIRKVNGITGIITTFAGGGTSFSDGIPATNAKLSFLQNVYGDGDGNIYVGERTKIGKINVASGIISTIAGTGVSGLSGDGGPAILAQLNGVVGMLFDASGNLIFADRGNSRIRKINKFTGVITTIAGTTDGYSGDGGQATAARLSGPLSFVIDYLGNIIIGDNQNNFIRKVDAATGIITTIAGVGTAITGDTSNGALALNAEIHPEFLYLDLQGNIYFSNYGGQIRKITNYNPGLASAGSNCNVTSVSSIEENSSDIEIYPNPTSNEITIKSGTSVNKTFTITNSIGQTIISDKRFIDQYYVNSKDWPMGIYFVMIEDVTGVHMRKIIKN